MSQVKNTNEDLIDLSNAFKNVCDGIAQAASKSNFNQGVLDNDAKTVSSNLFKLINIKCCLLVTESLSIEPLAKNPI
jgi:hypothetical protein